MAVGKGSMARAEKAAGTVKPEEGGTAKAAVHAEVIPSAGGNLIPAAAEEKPRTKRTGRPKKKEEPSPAAAPAQEKKPASSGRIISIGDEMPVYFL